jgi:ectoine hydroxylase-related dioxygenase (phytanoyl-CoA dioxygenase family)
MLLGLFVPGCATSKANGATKVVLRSHLWGDEKPDFGFDRERGVEAAELEIGEAIFMLGSLYHGGGHCSMNDGSRTMHIMFCSSGIYREKEISYLSYPAEDVKTYSKAV